MKIFHMPQLSHEWHQVRRGIPTASCADQIITPAKGEYSKASDKYINELIAELIFFSPTFATDKPVSRDMANGLNMEGEARAWYELERGVTVQQVGFCLTDDGRFGCSPDGLVGENGGLELKCPALHTHIGYLRHEGSLLQQYKCQVHMSLIVTGRKWWDLMSYAPDLPAIVIRVVQDEFTAKLRNALMLFDADYQAAKRLIIPHLSRIEEERKDFGGNAGELFGNDNPTVH